MTPRRCLLFTLQLHAGRSWETLSRIVNYSSCLFLVTFCRAPGCDILRKTGHVSVNKPVESGFWRWELRLPNWLDLLLERQTYPGHPEAGHSSVSWKQFWKTESRKGPVIFQYEFPECWIWSGVGGGRNEKAENLYYVYRDLEPKPSLWKVGQQWGIDLTLAEKVSSKSIDITDGMIRIVILSFIHEMFVKRPLWARHLYSGQPCLEG